MYMSRTGRKFVKRRSFTRPGWATAEIRGRVICVKSRARLTEQGHHSLKNSVIVLSAFISGRRKDGKEGIEDRGDHFDALKFRRVAKLDECLLELCRVSRNLPLPVHDPEQGRILREPRGAEEAPHSDRVTQRDEGFSESCRHKGSRSALTGRGSFEVGRRDRPLRFIAVEDEAM